MAGPGGGPPRRSHTKSRSGCESCKRRHIRCDENFPQCHNCTKHKARCPYNDRPHIVNQRAITPVTPDLMWTPEIEASIGEWKRTGVFPFPSLKLGTLPTLQSYSLEDMRLIYHIAAIYNDLELIGANSLTLWTRLIPTIMEIGAKHPFVMEALLALSAEDISNKTNCPVVGAIGYEHRGIALSGLRQAIGSFSTESSDAILAATLVLSWQAASGDWKGWKQIMQGTATIIGAIEDENFESKFHQFLTESGMFSNSPFSLWAHDQANAQDQTVEAAFKDIPTQLIKLDAHVKSLKGSAKLVQGLATLAKGLTTAVKSALKAQDLPTTHDQFDRLKQTRTGLFWAPVDCLLLAGTSHSSLLVIAYYYATAIMMEPIFPDSGSAYFGKLTMTPMRALLRQVESDYAAGTSDEDMQPVRMLMQFPRDIMDKFCSRLNISNTQEFDVYPPLDTLACYPYEHGTPPTAYLSYGDTPCVTWSQEEVSPMLKTEPKDNSSMLPFIMSSPYHNGQLLSIPSPSHGGYSPASSTFGEGSIAYSDNEEWGSFGPVEGEHDGFGVRNHRQHAHSSSIQSLDMNETPFYYHDPAANSPMWVHAAWGNTPSPLLEAQQWQGNGYIESTTPHSVAAPSPVLTSSPQSMHQRHSSAPAYYPERELSRR